MLFKKKDQNESSKAKTELSAAKALEKKDEARDAKVAGAKGGADTGKKVNVGKAAGRVSASILKRPRITEKATDLSAWNIYTFDVATSANKKTVASAVKDVYNVTPVKIRIVTIPRKHVMSRRGVHSLTVAGKKAYVYLKKGDTIELV
jgi:large subunit ribosomal protein L23